MKWYYYFIVGALLLLLIAGNTGVSKVEGVDLSELQTKIRETARDYRTEQNFDTACFVNGEERSIGAIMYGIIIGEGSHKSGSAGERTNNFGSLHKAVLKTPVRTEHIDNTSTRPVYASQEDGLYDMAHLVATNYCNITFNSLRAYIKGPRAEKTPDGVAYVKSHLGRLNVNARDFDAAKHKDGLYKKEQPTKKKDLSGECILIGYTKGDIQVDSMEGSYLGKLKNNGELTKIFKCF